ncbi:hypothetical protein HYV43_05440 [Candidatus Micrarchaeota archaeon]|nr:hypothetical protein [Candidatus Micrarchaeota archaeon]
MPELHAEVIRRRLQNQGWKVRPASGEPGQIEVHLEENRGKGTQSVVEKKLQEEAKKVAEFLKAEAGRRVSTHVGKVFALGDVDQHGGWKTPTRGFYIQFV